MSNCQKYLPFVSMRSLTTVTNVADYKKILDRQFHLSLSGGFDTHLDADFEAQSKRLREISLQLSNTVPLMQLKFTISARRHTILLSDNQALVVLGNLRLLLGCLNAKQNFLENEWSMALDKRPRAAEQMLNTLMRDMSNRPTHFWNPLSHIVYRNFSTLGVGCWLNDEIINHFVEKWCSSEGRMVLGLNTFFAGKHLFQQNACLTAKSGALQVIEDDEVRAERLGLESWDSVFIPIHKNSSHWYSVYIDYRCKRIEIYDSLRERCEVNRQKPVAQRKNTNLMLVIMWLTEVLGRVRGEDVCLSNNPGTDWVCDPHSKVHFQPNAYDCGVHTLWHLQHVLEYRQVRLTYPLDQLAFTDNMVGECLRLAQELIRDCES
ncbi:hypothetical protein D9757_012410 [Collybiopsis confluens]|uniref:Ubiquitin-like protease family profile domain-containing protein n=1 Tax=Collybiopsis confluens TaxID=2823264 RepID=A0A8H5H190_9AGAR|nr:hypothetical protein D9757_012410 [Collybiopsis confluens]